MKTTEGPAQGWQTVYGRAQAHAKKSELPSKFMTDFEDGLNMIRIGMEDVLIDAMPSDDPIRTAAEIEALCASRAARYWGTEKGLCRFRDSESRRRG